MATVSDLIAAEAFVERVDLSSCRRLLDVGAGTAAFTIATLSAVLETRATATDLPYMVEMMRSHVDKTRRTAPFIDTVLPAHGSR